MKPSSPSLLKNEPLWRDVAALDRLAVGTTLVIRDEARQIALFRPSANALYAIDNRCPHEGYPLVAGTISGTTLTCCRHNFKFELKTGKCSKGDEDVRTYDVRIVGNRVEVDVAEIPAQVQAESVLKSLHKGLWEGKMGQVARDVVRLLQLGIPPIEVAVEAIFFDAKYSEYGTSHVLPVVVDTIAGLPKYPGLLAATPIMQGMEMASYFHRRREKRVVPPRISFAGTSDAFCSELRDAVEAEDSCAAESLLCAGIEMGVHKETLQRCFYSLCSDHFLGFGHALIYTSKAFELLDAIGWQRAKEVLPALLFGIINQTREEVLPEWKWFRDRCESLVLEDAVDSTRESKRGVSDIVLDGSREEAFDVVVRELRMGTEVESLIDDLSLAASERILRFDARIDSDDTVSEGWLDVTHGLTFVHALRRGVQHLEPDAVLTLLLYASRFVQSAHPLDLSPEERFSAVQVQPGDSTLEALQGALETKDSNGALLFAARLLKEPGQLAPLRMLCEEFSLSDNSSAPIVVAHLIKVCRVAFEESTLIDSHLPILALVKFLSSPVRQRWVGQQVHEAIRFLRDGKVPTTLL